MEISKINYKLDMNIASAESPGALLCLHYCYQFTAFLCDFWESGSPVRAVAPTGPGWHPEAPGTWPLHMCISVEQLGRWHSPAGIRFLAGLQQRRLVHVAHQRCWRTVDTTHSPSTESAYMLCRTPKPLSPPSFAGRSARTLPVDFTGPWGGSSYSAPPF